jgi:phage I-like protein
MNPPILNREARLPADGWYEIETPGEHINRGAGVIQILDDQAFDAIVNRFRNESAEPNFAGLLIDRDHFSLDPEQTSESFGWLMELRNRETHLEGRIDWSDTGEAAVKGKRFKFFSTVYEPADCQQLGTRPIKNRSFTVMRPLRLDRLALTNDPNNKGGKPISNRNGTDADAGNNQPEPTMKNIIKLLGLAEDALEASAVDAIQTIINRATTAEAKVTSLQTERDGLLDSQVETILEKHKAVIKNRTAWKAHLTADLTGATILLEGIAAATPVQDPAHITNRAGAKAPEVVAEEAKAAKEKIRGAKIANRAVELRKTNPRLSRSQAFAKAEAEFPAE